MNSSATPSRELEALARRLLQVLGHVSGLESTYLTRIDWDAGEQEILVARNDGILDIPEGLRVGWADTLCRRALEGGPSATADVAGTYPDCSAAEALGLRTYVTAPVAGPDGAIYGTICGASSRAVELSAEARTTLEILAEMLALQLANDEANKALRSANAQLEQLAYDDTLTGVRNRRVLERELGRACSFARRHGVPISVVAIDVDRFKRVNDTIGHAGGDAALRLVGQALLEEARLEDAVVRVGGDEFVAILVATGADGASAFAERVRRSVVGTPVSTPRGTVTVTISAGVATGDGTDAELLLRQADDVLYHAKRAGRDTILTAASG